MIRLEGCNVVVSLEPSLCRSRAGVIQEVIDARDESLMSHLESTLLEGC